MIQKLLILILLLAGQCWPATQTIGVLPYEVTAHSGDTWDTIVIHPDSNAVLHSDRMGIIFNATNNDYFLIDLSGDDGIPGNADDDSIIFGIDSSIYSYGNQCAVAGIFTGGYGGGENLIVRGGYILHMPTGIDENSKSDTSETGGHEGSTHFICDGRSAVNAVGIYGLYGLKNCTFDSIAEIRVTGFGYAGWDGNKSTGSYAIRCRGTGILVRNCKLVTRHYGYSSRMSFLSGCLSYSIPGSGANALTGEQTYHIRVENSYIDAIGHCGLNFYATGGDNNRDSLCVVQVEACTLKMDNHNTYYNPLPVSDPGWEGWTNGWAIHYRGVGSDGSYRSYVKDNVFLSGTSFAGGRGMEIREGNEKADWHFFTPDTTGAVCDSCGYNYKECCPKAYIYGTDTCWSWEGEPACSSCCPWWYFNNDDTCGTPGAISDDSSCCDGGVSGGCDSAKDDCDKQGYSRLFCDSIFRNRHGPWMDTVEISGNYFDNHQGADPEYQTVWGSTCLKIRRGNHYYWIHDNTFINTLDSTYAIGANYHRHGTCVTYQIEMDWCDSNRAPYYLTFEDNVCSLRVLRDSTGFGANNAYIWGGALSISARPVCVTEIDTTIKVRNNHIYSEGGTCVIVGSTWDMNLHHFLFGSNDTLIMNDDSGFSKAAYSLVGASTYGNPEIFTKDAVFAGDAYDTSVSHYSKTGIINNNQDKTWELTFQRTLKLYIKGNNGEPVVSAVCSVWNGYGSMVLTGTSTNGGKVDSFVTYHYYSRNDVDSSATSFNPYIVHFHNSAQDDIAYDSSFNVDWTAAGGTDTLTLTSTVGTGEWDSDETSPQIAGIGPSSAWKDSTDDIVFMATDTYALDSITCYIRGPNSDSNSVHDTTFSEVVTSYSPTSPVYEYTWPDSGNVWIVVVAVDTCSTTGDTRDSLQLLVDVYYPPVSFKGIGYKGMTIKHK